MAEDAIPTPEERKAKDEARKLALAEKWGREYTHQVLERLRDKDRPNEFSIKNRADYREVCDMFEQAVLAVGWMSDEESPNWAIEDLINELENFTTDEILADNGLRWDDGILVFTTTGAPLVPNVRSAPPPSPYRFKGSGSLEEMNEDAPQVGSINVSNAARWELRRMLADEPREYNESQASCADRLRPGLRETLIMRGVIKSSDEYPALDRLRKMIAREEDGA